MSTPRILCVAGSLRRDSFSRLLLDWAKTLAPDDVEFDDFHELGAIPHFNQDLEGESTPKAVSDFRIRIGQADAVLVATPEYNGSMPGVLKNALDWASRPTADGALKNKPAAVVGASPGNHGAQWAQADVRRVLTAIGAEVLDAELAVRRVHEKIDANGDLRNAEQEKRLREIISALLELTGAPVPAELAVSAAYSQECQRIGVT